MMTAAYPATLNNVTTLAELLSWRASQTPKGEAYRQYNVQTQRWDSLTWAQAQERVAHWARALDAMQLDRGARVAILLPNGLDAMSIDQACLNRACTPVPLHAIDNPASVAYILADSAVSLLVVQTVSALQSVKVRRMSKL